LEEVERHTRVDAGFVDISDSSTFDHVFHREALDRLVLPYTARAVGATHEFDVATALLVTTAVSSFLCLMDSYVSIRSAELEVIQQPFVASSPNPATT